MSGQLDQRYRVLHALREELQRLKAGGVAAVPVSARALELIRGLGGSPETPRRESASPERRKTTPERAPREPLLIELPGKPAPSTSGEQPAHDETEAAKPSAFPPPPDIKLPDGTKQEQWAWLRQRVMDCPVCNEQARLSIGKKIVFGAGNLDADIFFCGEAPGADEETQGEPFVGKAGQLLTKIIAAMGLNREQVYISNVLNWRPVKDDMDRGNRQPTADEMAYCLPYIMAQIAIVKPRVIIPLGSAAICGLLGRKVSLSDYRGHEVTIASIPAITTYHPSHLLQNDTIATKCAMWEDILKAMERAGMPISAKQRGYFQPSR